MCHYLYGKIRFSAILTKSIELGTDSERGALFEQKQKKTSGTLI